MSAPKGEETIFAEALRLPPEERAAYLSQATSGNAELRRRVEALLGSYDVGEFLEQAAAPQLREPRHITVPLTERPGDTIGRYKLLQQIGEGGCGVVYMAEQLEPVRRRVALKIIKLGMDTKSVIARFEAERQAVAMMDHPNIAKVFDAGATEAGRSYFVMELVRGMKITDYCDEAKLSTRARLDLFMQVCQAIQHAHQKGIIHRDIKPSNILVTVNDGVPVPKAIDFGIAKATSGQQLTDKTLFTAFEQFIGTPAYMSPEQAVLTSLDIDTRSDIYALGVLLYELLTGKTPFDAKELLAIGLDEMRRTICEQEPPRPSTRLSTLPGQELSTTAQRRGIEAPKLVSELRGDLDWIVMKALEKDRARRYGTANGLASDIQRYLNNEPVTARPPSRLYRLRKMVRRNKLAFSAAAAVAIVLMLGIVVSAWQAQRAKTERDSAEAVLNFFQEKILAAGRPQGWEGGLGRETTLRQAIDAAEPQIAVTFQNRPVVEAAIRHTLGESYRYLGEPALAIQQQERALALRRQHLGSEHPDTFESMNTLGFEYMHASKLEQGLALLENALELRRRKLGPEHPDTLQSIANLVVAYDRGRKLTQAVALGEEALKLSKAKLGFEHRTTDELINNLSLAYMHSGKLDKAIALIEDTLNMSKARRPEHPRTLILTHNLARLFSEAGKWDRAMPLYEEVFELKKAKLGLEHPHTLLTMYWLAVGYREIGKTHHSLALFEELLKLRTSTLGTSHRDTLEAAEGLAKTYRKAGKLDQLEAMYREQLAQQNGDVLAAAFELGRLLLEPAKTNSADSGRMQDRAREGEQLLREYLAAARSRYTNDPLTLGWKFAEAAEAHHRRGNYAEAEPLYREQIRWMRTAWGTDKHYYVFGAQENLAHLLTDWVWAERHFKLELRQPNSKMSERARQAERLLRQMLQERLRESTNSLRIAVVKSRLAAALAAVEVTDPESDAESRERKLREGELLLLEGYQQLQNSFVDEKFKREAVQGFVRLYEAWDSRDKRIKWEQKLELFDAAQKKSSASAKAVGSEAK